MKQEIKTCQNCKKDFMIEPEDFNFYEKIKVPPPVLGMPGNAQNALAQRALALSPYLRVIRQENSFNPEFTELPRMCEFEA
ncbi:MAG: hypothetical protein UV85_C0003G0087 [Candidatus Nomurabacteria bacterium GW2011_GWB1_43_19]|nr:MAG: hypothetical protein UV85_C0003G0087 [Candidatus Nomurabacteria bacterium GW2011_GWB1_43_19]